MLLFALLALLGFEVPASKKRCRAEAIIGCSAARTQCGGAREVSLKRTLRIEIAAFRRTITVSGGEPDARGSERVPQGQDGGPHAADDYSAEDKQIDVVQAIRSSADNVRAPELTRLIEALVVSKGDGSHAAQQVRFRRKRVLFRLWTVSSSTKSLIGGGVSRIVSAISGLMSPRIK